MHKWHVKLFRSIQLTASYSYAELVAEKGDECLASSRDSACVRRMECERVRKHDVRHRESMGSEPPARVPPAGALGHAKQQGTKSEGSGMRF